MCGCAGLDITVMITHIISLSRCVCSSALVVVITGRVFILFFSRRTADEKEIEVIKDNQQKKISVLMLLVI